MRHAILIPLLLLAGCNPSAPPASPVTGAPGAPPSLSEARRGFTTKLTRRATENEPAPTPPRTLQLIRYDAPAGKLAAYLTPPTGDGKRHPAIVWVFGGFGNSIGETAWRRVPPKNDQSAIAYREAGIVTMYPSFRGGNDNPGAKEAFYGEVDDLLAAADFLGKQPHVDPTRVYLGGHSTGGTLSLLGAESTDRFRAVFCFGPADDVAGYGSENLPFDLTNPRELELRAPGRWLHSVRSPTFVFEGIQQGNLDSLQGMQRASKNPLVHFYPVAETDHFSLLAPLNRLIAAKIVGDVGPKTNIAFTEAELVAAVGR